MIQSQWWPENAKLLYDKAAIDEAMDQQAKRLMEKLSDAHPITIIALMNGGMIPATRLASRLPMAVRFDYVHATRYREARHGQDLQWIRRPEAVSGQLVLVDDIFDEGYTMAAVKEALEIAGAERVWTVAAVMKSHDRGLPRDWIDDAALMVPDEYVFGFGMDIDGLWRQLESIWSVP